MRRALAAAIDRQRLADESLGGRANVVEQLVLPEVFGHRPALDGLQWNLENARVLLTSAGWGAGFSTTLDYPEGKYRNIEAVARRIASDLWTLGVDVTLRGSPFDEFMEILDHGEASLFLLGWMTTWDAGTTYRYLAYSEGSGGRVGNFFRYSNPLVDGALERDAVTLQPRLRLEGLHWITETLRRELPFIPLYGQQDLYATRQGVQFAPRIDRRIVGQELGWSP